MKEIKKFDISPNMIFHTINSQAGSIEKGILECLMNAVDAGATKVEVSFNPNGLTYSILDNGKGFQTKEEIEKCFGVFGFDHGTKEENHRTYGTFGIGRAQLWSFSKNTWKTNEFILNVDIKNRGLDYDLIENKKQKIKGCHIEGEFYEKQSLSTLQYTSRELIKLALYLPIEFILDGKVVNKKCSDIKWDHETENAYVKFNETGDIKIYNQGVYVTSFSNYKFGKGGTIVSKTALELNTARNDILLAKCKVWKEVKAFVEEKAQKDIIKKEILSDDQCQNLFYKFISGEFNFYEFKKKKVFPDVKGKKVSLEVMMRYNSMTVSDKKGSQIGENILNKKLAFVLSPIILDWFDGSAKDLVASLNTIVQEKWSHQPNWIYKSFEELTKNQNSAIDILEKKDLTKKEKLHLEILEKMAYYVCHKINSYFQYNHEDSDRPPMIERKINFGETKLPYAAWTDGSTYIAFKKSYVEDNITKGIKGMNKLLLTMVHEYLHGNNSADAHVHSFDFFENFHEICFDSNGSDLMNINKECVKKLGQLYLKNNFSLPKHFNNDESFLDDKKVG